MSIKLIVTDIDDTVVLDDHMTVPAENIEALRRAHEAGVITAIASGRTLSFSRDIIADIGCIDYVILSNGSVIVDLKDDRVLFSNYIDCADAERIVKLLEQYNAVYEVYCGQNIVVTPYSYKRYETDLFFSEFVQYMKRATRIAEDMSSDGIIDRIEKFNVIDIDSQYRDRLETELKSMGSLEIISPYKGYIEITDGKSSKGAAVHMLCDRLGISSDEVMCIGDSNNDVSMLEWAGCSVAVGNAADNVQAVAKHVTASNEEAGVAKAIYRYVFNE